MVTWCHVLCGWVLLIHWRNWNLHCGKMKVWELKSDCFLIKIQATRQLRPRVWWGQRLILNHFLCNIKDMFGTIFFFWNNFSSKKLKIKINYIYLVFEIELFYDLNLSFTIIYLWKIIMSTFEQVRHNIYEACLT